MVLKLSNNAVSTTAASITTTATTVSVQSADAGKFPVLAAGDWFPATIVDASGNMEIVRVTARSVATLTIVRAQEGTTAKAFAAGARIDVRMTAAAITELNALISNLTQVVSDNASTTFNALDQKAPIDSPVFLGNPQAPTPPAGDNDLSVATTAFVTGAVSTAATYLGSRLSQKSAAYTAVKADNATAISFSVAATLALTAAATLGADWWCEVWATNGNVIIDPNGSQTIDGKLTAIVQTGQMAKVFCNGTAFFTEIIGDPLSGPQLQGYSFGLGLSTNAADAANDIDISVGSAAADVSPYALMQLATSLTKRIDAAWAVGNNAGGLDTGTVAAAGTYYLWLIQRSDTLVTDALFSLSATAPTMPTNYDRKRLLTPISRTGSANSEPLPFNRPTLRTDALVSLSGTAFDFTGIPADINKITILISGISLSASSDLVLLLGTSAGMATSGYSAVSGSILGSGTGSVASSDKIRFSTSTNITAYAGYTVTLERSAQANTWIVSGCGTDSSSRFLGMSGAVVLSSALTQFRITTVLGTPTISGSMRVKMEK